MSKESKISQNTESSDLHANSDNQNTNSVLKDSIIDLPKLSMQTEIKNSEIILAILEICTFNKKYNYECSNNTKAFWDRVVGEGILQKIFKNFKSETLRKYWKIIRQAGNTAKFVEIVRKNEKFINNPVFKLLPLINSIAYFIQTDEKNFEDFFTVFNGKRLYSQKEEKDKNSLNLIGMKRASPEIQTNFEDKDEKQIDIKQSSSQNNNEDMEIEQEKENNENNEVMLDLEETINKLMEISKFSREEVCIALYGTSYNIKNAFLYLKNNDKYEKYFFLKTDDYIIKNLRNKGYYKDLIEIKGIELVKEREKFLGIN